MFVFRKTTNILGKKLPLTATIFLFAHTLPEKLREQPGSNLPVLPIDAIFHFQRLYLPLYQPRFLQLLQMLGNSSLGNRQHLMNIPEKAGILFCQKFKDSHSCRMSHRLGKACKLLLLRCIFFILHFYSCLLFAKLQTKFVSPKYMKTFFAKTRAKEPRPKTCHGIHSGNSPNISIANVKSDIVLS